MCPYRPAVHRLWRAVGVACTAALLFLTPHALKAQNVETVVHDFPQAAGDGQTPLATPTADPSSGLIYVTTQVGGKNGKGSVVCLNPNAAASAVIHSFSGADGAYPTGPLLLVPQANGGPSYLYGATSRGGKNATGPTNFGTIFRVTTDGRVFQTLHSFTGGPTDGDSPRGGLILGSNGNLFGTTLAGGRYGFGTVFTSTTSGKTTVVHSFAGQQPGVAADGARPYARVLEFKRGLLVGTTAAGGNYGLGTVFLMNFTGDLYALVHTFTGGANDGANPTAELTLTTDSTGVVSLFGVTVSGGANNGGIIYQMDGSVKTFSLVYSLGAPGDAANPRGGLAFNSRTGLLYGAGHSGGLFGVGAVFVLNASSSTKETVVYSFNPFGLTADGAAPAGGLVLNLKDGLLYGTCSGEGTNFGGTVYSITP